MSCTLVCMAKLLLDEYEKKKLDVMRAVHSACLVAHGIASGPTGLPVKDWCRRVAGNVGLKRFGHWLVLVLVSMCFLDGPSRALAGQPDTVERVRERGHLVCGTANDEMGFSSVSSDGEWSGLYIDLCRAIATAVLGDAQAVKFIPLVGPAMFRSLADGKIDVLARNTAWTASRVLQYDVSFAGTFFFDGKGFLIRKSSGILSALELSGADVCLIEKSLTEASVQRYFSRRGMRFNAKQSETWTDVLENYKNRTCLVLAADSAQLSILRNSLADKDQHSLLPELFEADAFGPYVARKDDAWRAAVEWIIHAFVWAEQQNLSRSTIAEAQEETGSNRRPIFSIADAAGRQFGFVDNWLVQLISKLGHYGEVFERNLGKESAIGLNRGPNRPASVGGLLRAPALR